MPISNNRIVKLEDGKVTFRYKDSATHQIKTSTLSPERFIGRFSSARVAPELREGSLLRVDEHTKSGASQGRSTLAERGANQHSSGKRRPQPAASKRSAAV
jgi:Putative transposase